MSRTKICSCVIFVICAVYIFWGKYAVHAATVTDGISDDTFRTANNITLGDTIQGSITETDDLDYYRFTLQEAGAVDLDMTSRMKYYCIKIFDTSGTEIWYTDRNEWNEKAGYVRDTYDVYLEKGTYYMEVNGYYYGTSFKSTGIYDCVTKFISSGVNNVESDNSFAAANKISMGNTCIGQISANDDFDTYQFTLPKPGRISLDITSYMKYYCIKLFDDSGKELWYTDENEWTSTLQYRQDQYQIDIESGTYYLEINGYQYRTSYKSTGKYVVKTGYTPTNVSFMGDDSSFATAKQIVWNQSYTGQISLNNRYDTYKFVLGSAMDMQISITSRMKYYCILLFDSTGKEIWYTDGNEWNSTVKYRSDTYTDITLSAGTYYMQINGYSNGHNNGSTGTYSFEISEPLQNPADDLPDQTGDSAKISIDKASVSKVSSKTYTGSAICPGVTVRYNNVSLRAGIDYTVAYTNNKNVGKATITVSGTGKYNGSQSISFKIIPKKISSVSVSTKKKGTMTVKWKKTAQISGYQIVYSANRNFKNSHTLKVGKNTTSKTIKSLKKGKTYYVKVRGYKTVGGKKYYGAYSGVKKKKCK